MKQLALTIIMTLASSLALAAGGTGGGGWKPGPMAMTSRTTLFSESDSITQKNPEIVFNKGQKNGFVRFAYGQLIENEWKVEEIQATYSEILDDPSLQAALNQSKNIKNWSFIQQASSFLPRDSN